jgi:hypothetical protein
MVTLPDAMWVTQPGLWVCCFPGRCN